MMKRVPGDFFPRCVIFAAASILAGFGLLPAAGASGLSFSDRVQFGQKANERDHLVQTGGTVKLERMADMAYVAQRYGQTHVLIGHADTRILLSGAKAEIRADVERCMAIGKRCPGFFMSVGNHIPPNTPVENALYYQKVCDELSRR